MFKSLDVINFQSHKSTHIDFSSGVNLIIGKSDSGKSAIIRAINWLVNNRPLGDGVLRDGAEDSTHVCIKTDLGIADKTKNKKDHVYGLDEKCFEAFGTSVPKEIVDFFNMTDINLQSQLSPYFLVLESSGHIGAYLREICKLDKLDELYANLTSKLNSAENKKLREKEELRTIEEDFLFSEQCVLSLDSLEELISDYEIKDKEYKELNKTILELTGLINSISQIKIVEIPKTIDEGLGILLESLDYLKSNSEQINGLGAIIDGLGSLMFVALPEALGGLFEQYDELVRINTVVENDSLKIVDLVKYLTNENVRCLSNNQAIVELESKQLKMFGELDVCPYCESNLSENGKVKLLENVK